MLAAAGVEAGLAMRTGIVGSHVVFNAQFISADAAENCLLVKLNFWPNLRFMIRFLLMAGKAWVIFVAAFELDRDDVQLGMPMHAAGLVVHRFSEDVDPTDLGHF